MRDRISWDADLRLTINLNTSLRQFEFDVRGEREPLGQREWFLVQALDDIARGNAPSKIVASRALDLWLARAPRFEAPEEECRKRGGR